MKTAVTHDEFEGRLCPGFINMKQFSQCRTKGAPSSDQAHQLLARRRYPIRASVSGLPLVRSRQDEKTPPNGCDESLSNADNCPMHSIDKVVAVRSASRNFHPRCPGLPAS
jgi:hypothetical protein